MRAMVIRMGGDASVMKLETIETPHPKPGEARVHLKAAALNHRDIWQRKAYAGPAPMILGSDGAGTVAAVGSPEDGDWVGKDVVINPSLYWGDREDAPSSRFQILGNPTPGTYAEHIVIPVDNLALKPAHLNFVQAATLPLAALTAWRALFTQGDLKSGETLLLPGIGSGVAGLALAFGKRAGARVIVTSSGPQKLKDALAQGADAAINYTAPDWEQQVREAAGPGGIDLVLDHSGAQTIPAAIRLVRHGGRIVFLGATTGPQVTFSLRDVFFKQLHLIGTTMGSPREFEALFRFIGNTRFTPDVRHIFRLEDAGAAHSLMEAGGQFGKIALQI